MALACFVDADVCGPNRLGSGKLGQMTAVQDCLALSTLVERHN
jgi:hypothetical protein